MPRCRTRAVGRRGGVAGDQLDAVEVDAEAIGHELGDGGLETLSVGRDAAGPWFIRRIASSPERAEGRRMAKALRAFHPGATST